MRTLYFLFLLIFFVSCEEPLELPKDPYKPMDIPQAFMKDVVNVSPDGYKVNTSELTTLKNNGEEFDYWKNCGVMMDLIVNKFNTPLVSGNKGGSYLQVTTGDFNNDGWIDVFNPGAGKVNGLPTDYFNWFIWNPTTKTFDRTNLFTDKSFKFIGENARRSISVDLNKDGFTDVIIIDGGDDYAPPGNNQSHWQPIRIVLSKSDGSYELKTIDATGTLDGYHNGDIGDLNKDGNPDLVLLGGKQSYISWGTGTYPYFGNGKISKFDIWNKTDNGFGEWIPEIALGINLDISDVNKDGWQDMILGNLEDINSNMVPYYKFNVVNRVMLNGGNGKFSKSGIIELPTRIKQTYLNNDYKVIDVNNDGLNDIVGTGAINYKDWDIVVYIQQKDKTFKIDNNFLKFTNSLNNVTSISGKHYNGYLTLFDYNKDGLMDIGYIDDASNPSLTNKTVLINKNGHFLEEDYYKYDDYARTIRP